jgi:probable phosphoglycerate mutase
MRLIITRHAETKENKAGIMQGHLPGRLSAVGKRQANKIAQKLKKTKIDLIFSSDLDRAADTTATIARSHPKTPVKLVKDLRQRHFGELQGKKKNDFDWCSAEYRARYLRPKGGESMQSLYQRIKKFFNKIIIKYPEKTILIVGHNAVSRALVAVITGLGHKDIINLKDHHCAGISIFDIDSNKNYQIRRLNCTNHLN